jgi:hypothetical protein
MPCPGLRRRCPVSLPITREVSWSTSEVTPSSYTILHIVPIIPRYVVGVGTIVSISGLQALPLTTELDELEEREVGRLRCRNAGDVKVAI